MPVADDLRRSHLPGMNERRRLRIRAVAWLRCPRALGVAAIGLGLVLAGCSALLRTVDDGAEPTTAAALPADVRAETGALRSSSGCRLDYRLYRPERHSGDALVVLGHGFLRSQARMTDLAAALAADGIAVATLDFCNMSPWDGGHVQNGRDMIALARALEADRVVYAGFSAGALAALIAGRNDRQAAGIVALDLVDQDDIGLRAARGLDKPLLGLSGEPTNCNAGGNGRRVYAASDQAVVQHIAGAGHCDFESPTDGLCELICEDPDGAAPSQRRAIIGNAVAAVREVLDHSNGEG